MNKLTKKYVKYIPRMKVAKVKVMKMVAPSIFTPKRQRNPPRRMRIEPKINLLLPMKRPMALSVNAGQPLSC